MKLVARVAKVLSTMTGRKDTLAPVGLWAGFSGWPRVLESYAGAWQSNVTVDRALVTAYWAVFACTTLIASDISKLFVRVMQLQPDGTSKETTNRPVLQTPNDYQTRAEFFFNWVISLLLFGNAYIYKIRDEKNFVKEMHVLNPYLVTPLVSPNGLVFYRLGTDNLAQVKENQTIVPATEIIHDRLYTLHHPLVGCSPLYACGVAAMQGLAIQDNATKFFQNMSRPSGILTAPGAISNEVAQRLKSGWEDNYKAGNFGRVAVLGDNLKYEPLVVNAHDSQLIEQLKMTAEMVCACYHVPPYKIGVGPMPTVNNTATLNQQYYDQCLQFIIEKMELRLDDGLELERPFYAEFDLQGLLRMDPMARYDAHQKAIAGGWLAPNEARLDENRAPVKGGDSVYLQSQNQSLAALDKRDSDVLSGKDDVQASAMNGAQVTSLQGMLLAVAEGKMPKETAKAAIGAAFPLLEEGEINGMVDPIREGSAPPSTTTAPTVPTDEPEDEEEIDGERLLQALYEKSPEELCHA